MNDPLVSIVIPFYSGIDWLEEALNSVLNQEYKNVEILVINDGSKEDISHLRDKYKALIKFVYKENGGPASARNKGMNIAKGKYIAFLDSDDIWLPEKLQRQVQFMERNKSIWSQHSYEMFWEEKSKTKIINTSKYNGDITIDSYVSLKIQTSCVVVLKEAILKNKIYFPENKRFGQDSEFYRSLAKLAKLDYVDGVLSRFRIRGNNAGFQAKIQIEDRSSVWKEMKLNKDIVGMLPKSIILAFKLSSYFAGLIKNIQVNISNNKAFIEMLAKVLYVVPYMIFKINSIILSKR